MALGDLSQGHPTTTITDDLLPIDIQPSPTDPLPFELGPSHSGPNSFYDQTSFEFADSTNDDDHGATQWAGGIDVFSKTDEIDVQISWRLGSLAFETADRTLWLVLDMGRHGLIQILELLLSKRLARRDRQ